MTDNQMTLHLRRRNKSSAGGETLQEIVSLPAVHIAIIICDMWDDHWCRASARRVVEMAPVMNAVLHIARQQGVFIIHAPSDTMEFYAETPQRQRARLAPKALPQQFESGIEDEVEPPLPIDDSDNGCDSEEKPWHKAWTRQIALLEIAEEDAISDSGEEIYNLLQERGIAQVLLMGVHTNMCILNRPFAIRRLREKGVKVALMRDMTDTMYNPEKHPFVSHVEGTDLVVQHIETYLCPTLLSTDFTGKPPFRFQEDTREVAQNGKARDNSL